MNNLPPQTDLHRQDLPSTSGKVQEPATPQPLVSSNTVWIVWGFLVGIVGQTFIQPSVQLQLCGAGVLGIALVWGWGIYCRHQAIQASQAMDEAALRLEDRIDRHIPRPAPLHSHTSAAERGIDSPQFLSPLHQQRESRHAHQPLR